MNAELEELSIDSSDQSFQYFKIETEAFTPYWHYHPEVELTFIIRGEGTRFIGNSIEPFSDDDLVLVGTNIPHHWVSYNRQISPRQKAVVFQFSPEIFSSIKECRGFQKLFELGKRGIHFQNPSPEIKSIVLNFHERNQIQQVSSLIELLHLLDSHEDRSLLATEIYVHHHNQKHKIEKFGKVNNYILENLSQKLTVNRMAELTHMVPQSFCRWFKRNSGRTFVTFLNKARIEYACQLLIHGEMPIQEVAFSSGFESLSHFNRTFKEFKEMNPSQYKKSRLILRV